MIEADEIGEVANGTLGSRILCRYCRNSAEGASGGPQAGSSKRSMSCREATCAGHKRQHVKTDPRRFSLQL